MFQHPLPPGTPPRLWSHFFAPVKRISPGRFCFTGCTSCYAPVPQLLRPRRRSAAPERSASWAKPPLREVCPCLSPQGRQAQYCLCRRFCQSPQIRRVLQPSVIQENIHNHARTQTKGLFPCPLWSGGFFEYAFHLFSSIVATKHPLVGRFFVFGVFIELHLPCQKTPLCCKSVKFTNLHFFRCKIVLNVFFLVQTNFAPRTRHDASPYSHPSLHG